MEQKQHKQRPKVDSTMPGWQGNREGYRTETLNGRYGVCGTDGVFANRSNGNKRGIGGSHGIMRG